VYIQAFHHPRAVRSYLFCVPHGFIPVHPNNIADKKLGLAAFRWFYSEFLCCLSINTGRTVAANAKKSLSRVEISFVKWVHLIRSSGHEEGVRLSSASFWRLLVCGFLGIVTLCLCNPIFQLLLNTVEQEQLRRTLTTLRLSSAASSPCKTLSFFDTLWCKEEYIPTAYPESQCSVLLPPC